MGSKKAFKEDDLFMQETTTSENVVDAPEPETKAAAPKPASSVYVYIGPNIKGVINNGAILLGSKDEAVSEIGRRAENAEKSSVMAKISRLVVADTDISSAMAQLKAGGNALSEVYKAILAEV